MENDGRPMLLRGVSALTTIPDDPTFPFHLDLPSYMKNKKWHAIRTKVCTLETVKQVSYKGPEDQMKCLMVFSRRY